LHPVTDPAKETLRSLENPIGSLRLKDRLQAGMR
jgi:hypothetical protein